MQETIFTVLLISWFCTVHFFINLDYIFKELWNISSKYITSFLKKPKQTKIDDDILQIFTLKGKAIHKIVTCFFIFLDFIIFFFPKSGNLEVS